MMPSASGRLQVGEAYANADAHLEELLVRVGLQLERLELARAQDLAGASLLDDQLLALDETILSREHASDAAGIVLPLARLRETLSLSRVAEKLLIALAAVELSPKFLIRVVRLWADGRQGDVAFYRELIAARTSEVPQELSPAGVLVRHGLVVLSTDKMWGAHTPPLYKRVRLGQRVSGFLGGELLPSARVLSPALTVRAVGRPLDRMVVSPELIDKLSRTLRTVSSTGRRRILCLSGPRHIGRKSLIQGILQQPLVILDAARLGTDLPEAAELLRDALCETALQNGVLYVDRGESLVGEAKLRLRQSIGEALSGLQLLVCIGLEGNSEGLADAFPDLETLAVPMPDSLQQSMMWSLLLPDGLALEPGHGVDWLASHYSLPAGAIHRCIDEMMRIAETGQKSVIEHNDVVTVVRRQLGSRFGDLAELIVTTFTWEDLVLPSDTLQRVLEIVMYFRHRDKLLRDWGFEAKLPYGRSLSVLLSGEPGTGKTMVASLLAKEMGLELFRVNVSQVVDKYIGETEKNLGRIFDEAKRGQVALLFDEADSLFSKRTEVRSSTDRYSNLAINFLLQSVESHEGVIILTTNHDKAMDVAFKRRLRFRVRFPFPERGERAILWKSMVPSNAPIDPDIGWDNLANDFDLAGGSIKNAVVRAALHAVEKGTQLSEQLLRHTAGLEAEEMGHVVLQGDAPPVQSSEKPTKPARKIPRES